MRSPISLHPLQLFPLSRLHTRRLAPASVVLTALVVLSACSSTTTNTGNNGTPSTTSTTAPAATKTPLSEVPQITLAFCQGLVSLADANTIMKPASPATSIVPDNARPGGSCSYVNPQVNLARGGLVLTLFFLPFPAGTSLNAIAQEGVAQAAAKNNFPALSITTTSVSGIGDQALFGSASGTVDGMPVFYYGMYTTIGSVEMSCFNFGVGSPTTPQQPALTQVCTQAASRL